MTILQQPDALSLSMNLKKFIISSDAQISFVLKKGTEEVLSQRYDPDSQGRIEIDMRDVVHAQLSFDFRGSAVRTYEQTNLHAEFTAEIDGQAVNFHAVRGGVDNLADTATNFLTQNWLTWQPTVKPVTYYTPEFLTYYAPVAGVVKLRGYFVGDDGQVTSQKDIVLCSVEAGKAYTIPVEYQVVVSLLYPDGKPGYYDVWVENASGERLTYIQRYYADAMRSISEDWVLFENSLGGVDCFRAYGKTNLEADHTHNLAEVDEVSEEYRVDTERKYEKNTGHLSKDEARWLLDFFPSQKKYIYVGSYLRQIVVVESNVTGNLRELPTNYTFTYKYADARPLLNLPRTDVPADMLDITIPEVGNFTIPPRLAEVPRLPLSEGDLFPVQNPYSETWSTTTVGALADVVGQLLSAAAGTGGGVGHTHKNIDLLNLLSYVEEYLLVNGKTIKAGYADTAGDISSDKYIRKDQPDETEYLIKFLSGIEIGEFVSGLLGTGGAIQIDQNGCSHAEFDYLTIRKLAIFIELIIQEAKHVGGMLIVSPSGMTISKVEETDTAYRCYFEQTDGDRTLQNQFTVGTQARRQTFNLTNQAYYWRLVTAVGSDYIDLSKTDCDTGSTIPQAGDELVGLGHRTDKMRQAAIIISAFGTNSPSIMYYQGIDSYSLDGKAVKMDYYDPVSGRFQSVTYGDTYVGAEDGSTYMKYNLEEGLKVKGRVSIQAGSTGASSLDDLPEEVQKAAQVGSVNLLLNTGFTGNYETEELNQETLLNEESELYSKALLHWNGTATIQEDAEATSGRSAVLGSLTQVVKLIESEKYVVSYKAKGTSVSLSCGGYIAEQTLTAGYQRYVHKFTYAGGGTFSISGAATVCDIKLERGTIATDYSPNPQDSDKANARFQALQYILDAIVDGRVDMVGGLILATMINVGNYKDGVLQKVTAGLSGIYNDDDDVYTWGGGTMEQAIYTVMKYKHNPQYQPTDEELANMANAVITHGGRAILNDVILRGYIYALGGRFLGDIEAKTLQLGITQNEDGQVCDGACAYFSNLGLLPELQEGKCREIKLVVPLVTRAMISYVFKGENDNVKIALNGDYLNRSNEFKSDNSGGASFYMIGTTYSNETIWSIFPMNDTANDIIKTMSNN